MLSLTRETALSHLGSNYQIIATRTNGFKVDLKPILVPGNKVTDDETHTYLQTAKEFFTEQGYDVTVKYTTPRQGGRGFVQWPHLWANQPNDEQAEPVRQQQEEDMAARVARLEAELAAANRGSGQDDDIPF